MTMRAAITAWGAVTAFGAGVSALAAGLREGRTGVRTCTRFATEGLCSQLAAESPVATEGDRAKGLLQLALDEAQVRSAEVVRGRAALIGTTKGMLPLVLERGEKDAIAPLAAHFARSVGAGGPVRAVGAACASSSAALGQALQLLRSGGCEEAIVAGVEGLHAFVYSGFHALKAISPVPAAPFDGARQGLSMGEAAVVLRLEPEARAKQLGREVLAYVEGFGTAVDAHDQTAPHPKGDGLFNAVQAALRSAGAGLEQIGRYHAHGTATPHNDRMEAAVVERLFGARPVPLTAIKGAVGHTLGAAGALDVLGCALGLNAREVWPVVGHHHLDPSFKVSPVLQRRADESERAIVATAGFGGLNTALVIARGSAR
jgi:3-oxoacyl-[acyl-carrier-protein] synthase II